MSEAVTVAQGAHTNLQCSSNEYSVETSLADYIKTEYPALTKQQPAFYTVPADVPEPEPGDKGGYAEYVVYDRLKKFSESLGLTLILFCGSAYAGRKGEGCRYLPKEVDFVVFIAHDNLFKAFVLEVKGSEANIKKLTSTKTHAMSQLKNHREIFGFEFQIPEIILDKITQHVVWPNIQSTEYCETCNMDHKRFIRKPPNCKKRGSNSKSVPDKDDGCHLFEDTFTQYWLANILDIKENNLTESDWNFALQKFLILSAGALYDEMDKTFVLLREELKT